MLARLAICKFFGVFRTCVTVDLRDSSARNQDFTECFGFMGHLGIDATLWFVVSFTCVMLVHDI